MQSTGTALHRHGEARSEPVMGVPGKGKMKPRVRQIPGKHGEKETQRQVQTLEFPASLQAGGRGFSIVICSAVLWPRQPAGKSNLVSPSLAQPHSFGSMGSPPGTVVFPAESCCMPAVSQHARERPTAAACEP